MTKWIVDCEVESHASVMEDGKKLIYKHPNSRYEVHISNLSVGPGLERQILSVQIIFECENIDKASDQSRSLLNSYLDHLCLVTSSTFKIHKVLRILDWSPGLKMRDCYQFEINPDPSIPYPILNDDLIESTVKLTATDIPIVIQGCMHWYSLGVRATYSDEQFENFWRALEQLAQHEKNQEKVPDKCSRCGSELYCPQCKTVTTHKPYPKHAIEQLIHKRVKGEPARTFEILSKYRHALFHGENVEDVEAELQIPFSMAVDILGKTVRAALISSFRGQQRQRLKLIEPRTFAHGELIMKGVLQLGSSKDDINNPKIENFRGTKMHVEFYDRSPPDPNRT